MSAVLDVVTPVGIGVVATESKSEPCFWRAILIFMRRFSEADTEVVE